MALSASISGWQHFRLVISIDGTSLKNKYDDTFLSVLTPNANDQIFPLAFCVVDSENDSSSLDMVLQPIEENYSWEK